MMTKWQPAPIVHVYTNLPKYLIVPWNILTKDGNI